MKSFFAGTLFGIVLSGLGALGLLYKMGKLEAVVDRFTDAAKPAPPFPYKVAPDPKPEPKPEPKIASTSEPVKIDLNKIDEPKIDTPPPPAAPREVAVLGNCGAIGKPLTPPDSVWNQDISNAPVSKFSEMIIARIGANRPLHPEFGAMYRGAPNGIPYVVVPGDQRKVPVLFDRYGHQSDAGPYPVPDDIPIEGGPKGTGDRHAIMLDRDNWKLYELFDLRKHSSGRWIAASGAIFDLKTNATRPRGWTSADAAGLPILPGLVRYDEVMIDKEIRHALRFTVPKSRKAYIPPATHFASVDLDNDLPPMGMRVRLKADFDISGFPEEAQIILRCLKKYGMIVADNGAPWFISGSPHPNWVDINTHEIKKVFGRDLEVIEWKDIHYEAD